MNNINYNIKEIIQRLEELVEEKDKKFISFEGLMFTIGYNPINVNLFYTKWVKHRVKYGKW